MKTAKREGELKGLLAVWAHIGEDYRVEYEKFLSCEHMADRVTLPGFHVGHRYHGIGNAPVFFIFYETSDSEALASKEYLHSLNNPSPWTRESIRHLRNMVRTIYSLLATEGKKPPMEAPYLIVHRFNSETGSERDVIRWFREECLPAVCSLPFVYRGRLYESDPGISNIMTEERKVHGAGSGEQRFLAIYEISSLDPCTGEHWHQAAMDTEHGESMLKKLTHINGEFYWHGFTMYEPEPE